MNYFNHSTIYRGPPTKEREEAWDRLWRRKFLTQRERIRESGGKKANWLQNIALVSSMMGWLRSIRRTRRLCRWREVILMIRRMLVCWRCFTRCIAW